LKGNVYFIGMVGLEGKNIGAVTTKGENINEGIYTVMRYSEKNVGESVQTTLDQSQWRLILTADVVAQTACIDPSKREAT
jgi:hypothetical protein